MSSHRTDRAGARQRAATAVRRFAQAMPGAVLVLDAGGAVLAANERAAALIGESEQGLAGRPLAELFEPADHERLRRILYDGRIDPETPAVLSLHSDRDAERLVEVELGEWISDHALPVRLLALTDVSERIRRERVRDVVEQGQAFMAETAALLEASLDPVQTLQRIASLAVPAHAELCVIDLLNDRGALEGVGLAAADPEIARALEQVRREQPLDRDGQHPVARVLRDGRPLLLERMDEAFYARIAASGSHLELMRKLRYRSAIVAPLTARGRTFGVISLLYLSAGLRYTETDLQILVDVARRAALALDNARLYAREHRIAETLQRSLLPAQLPEIPGIALAARYEPGEGDVGGDWYDALVLPDGRIGCVVGDIVGRGLEAASVMGQLRNAVRVYALELGTAGAVVAAVDRFATSMGIGQTTTLVYAIIDPAAATVELCSAGHPPPLLLEPGGGSRFLQSGRSMPLAIGAPVAHAGAVESFPVGSMLVLYTDGLVERRGEPLDKGLRDLQAVVAGVVAAAPGDPSRLVDTLVARMRAGANHDDLAVFAIRSVPDQGQP